MKQRSGFSVMARLVGLVRPLVGYMLLAIAMGLLGHTCAALITVFGGYALLELLHFPMPLGLGALFACMLVFAVLRGAFRYAEQTCNHFIAFKLLARIRDQVFRALRSASLWRTGLQSLYRVPLAGPHPRSCVRRFAPALSGQA